MAGERGAWDTFVERFAKLIYWSIRRTLEAGAFKSRNDLVDDIFQEVFAELFEKESLKRLRDAKNIRRFLVVMAAFRTSNKVRELSLDGKKTVEIDHDALYRVPDSLDGETERLVGAAIAELKPKERYCVEQHYVHGRTHAEIAEVLGLPRDTVSSVLRRSHEKLEKKLKEKGF